MELGKRIKDYRSSLNWNQDELAEKMFVSRQTISNWENEKSYPDIQSLLLLSTLFDVSIDQLVKGDVEKMQKIINEQDVNQMKFYGKAMLMCLLILILTFGPAYLLIGLWSLVPEGLLIIGTLYFSIKLGTLQKENDVSTYKEIVSFMNGKTLDEATKQQEIGKRPYQTTVVTIASALIAGVASLAVVFVCKNFLGL
ncbi:DNA-binding transcriptional regulator, XRE-family HTH domain [Pseudobutyrivibrio sp. UC1225]|uniref:helix-turn-helix domain-containing protein n=1 Tax=Pseudobutyrivibrio sp. UC1225 TaxID=1798185 RepID=UPI0008E28916|nr:helix-turn-helix transcriptional regulator [Pseudobutyrivibrio sp. UC1225]SFN87254.1 DNA-binding transcriptional regulator, XRE-family HTH domain [Pseudobutyrivibrio sp. UC1225]